MKYDFVTFTLIFGALCMWIWLMVNVPITNFDDLKLLLVPFALLISGLVVEEKLRVKQQTVGVRVEESINSNVMLKVILAIAGFFIAGLFVNLLPLTVYKNYQLSVVTGLTLGIVMAISEEVFFRGALVKWLDHNAPKFPQLSIISGGFGFMAYHALVLGGDPRGMIFIFFAGCIGSYIFLTTKKAGWSLAPTTFAHIIYNTIVLSFPTQMSAIKISLPEMIPAFPQISPQIIKIITMVLHCV